MFLVISSSLSPSSRSRLLAQHVRDLIQKAEQPVELLDLAETGLPRCDASSCYSDPAAVRATELVREASGIILATPIYNYSIGSEAKNLIELSGKAWQDSVAGFLCAAGGQGSYMSVMQIANSLMLDFRTVILPRFVYATGDSFAGNEITDNDLLERMQGFADDMIRLTVAVANSRSEIRP